MNHSSYLDHAMQPSLRHAAAQRVATVLTLSNWEFDALAFTGLSGTLVGVEAAELLGKPFIIVRKRGEASHGKTVEATIPKQDGVRWVFIDESIESGSTFHYVHGELGDEYTDIDWLKSHSSESLIHYAPPICVGIVLYAATRHTSVFGAYPILNASGPKG